MILILICSPPRLSSVLQDLCPLQRRLLNGHSLICPNNLNDLLLSRVMKYPMWDLIHPHNWWTTPNPFYPITLPKTLQHSGTLSIISVSPALTVHMVEVKIEWDTHSNGRSLNDQMYWRRLIPVSNHQGRCTLPWNKESIHHNKIHHRTVQEWIWLPLNSNRWTRIVVWKRDMLISKSLKSETIVTLSILRMHVKLISVILSHWMKGIKS